MIEEKPRTEKYWICPECAEAKTWKPSEWPVTVIFGLCGWCARPDTTTLTPVVDYTGPGKRSVWD